MPYLASLGGPSLVGIIGEIFVFWFSRTRNAFIDAFFKFFNCVTKQKISELKFVNRT